MWVISTGHSVPLLEMKVFFSSLSDGHYFFYPKKIVATLKSIKHIKLFKIEEMRITYRFTLKSPVYMLPHGLTHRRTDRDPD